MTKFESGGYFLLPHGNHFFWSNQYPCTQKSAVSIAGSCRFIRIFSTVGLYLLLIKSLGLQ